MRYFWETINVKIKKVVCFGRIKKCFGPIEKQKMITTKKYIKAQLKLFFWYSDGTKEHQDFPEDKID